MEEMRADMAYSSVRGRASWSSACFLYFRSLRFASSSRNSATVWGWAVSTCWRRVSELASSMMKSGPISSCRRSAVGVLGRSLLQKRVLAETIGDPLVAGLLRLKLLHIHINPNNVMPAAQGAKAVGRVSKPGLKICLSRQPILVLGMPNQMGKSTFGFRY